MATDSVIGRVKRRRMVVGMVCVNCVCLGHVVHILWRSMESVRFKCQTLDRENIIGASE